MKNHYRFFSLFLILAFSGQTFAQQAPYFNQQYRRDSNQLQDSMRNHSFERIVYDNVNNHLYTIMQTVTKVNDSVEYSFPVMMRIDPLTSDVLLEKSDSLSGFNIAYTALWQQGDYLYWAGSKMAKNLDDSEQAYAFITKTDKSFNIIWRKELPSSLKFSRATQIKQYGDNLFVSSFHWTPAGSTAFAPQALRSNLWTLDTAGNILNSISLSEDTTVLHAAYDFERLDNSDYLIVGRTYQWDGVGNAFTQRIQANGQNVWHQKMDSTYSAYSAARKILKLNNTSDFLILGSHASSNQLGHLGGRYRNPFNYKIDTNGTISNFKRIISVCTPMSGFESNQSVNSAILTQSGNVIQVGSTSILVKNITNTGYYPITHTGGLIHKSIFNQNQECKWSTWYTTQPIPLGSGLVVSAAERQIMNCPDYYWDSLECTATYQIQDEHFKDLVELPNGDLVIAGATWSSYKHPNVSNDWTLRKDAWLLKTDSNGCFGDSCKTITSINKIPASQLALEIYPNPATNKVIISWDINIAKLQQIAIYDMLGRSYLKQSLNNTPQSFDIANWPVGMYQAILKDDKGNIAIIKFLKQ